MFVQLLSLTHCITLCIAHACVVVKRTCLNVRCLNIDLSTLGQCDSQLCGKQVEVDLGNYSDTTSSEQRPTIAKMKVVPGVVT